MTRSGSRHQPVLTGTIATRRCMSVRSPAGREGGRVLSHPQELPLTCAGSRRALAKTGACGQLGSRTANRMAVPRALPLGSARALRGQDRAKHTPRRQGGKGLDVFCGIDWAEDHHDIALADRDGKLLAHQRSATTRPAWPGCWNCSPNTATRRTTRSRWRSRLRAGSSWPACAPPGAASTRSTRWRWPATGTGTPSPAEINKGDAAVLANVLRTDLHAHRPLPADSELAQAVAVLAGAQQDAVWNRTSAHNKLRSHLREYFPGFLPRSPPRAAASAPRSARHPRRRPHPGRRGAADPRPAARPAEEGRPRPRHRRRVSPAARSLPAGTDAPAPLVEQAMGRQPRPAPPSRRRLRQRRRPRAGRRGVF